MADDPMIAALLRERAGYLSTGQKERAALVDEQLVLRGHKVDEPAKDPEHTPPKGRQAPPRRTAS